MENIFESLKKNEFSYSEIREKSEVFLLNNEEYDINIIIGFRGRKEFISPLINSFQKAFDFFKINSPTPKRFCLTFVEHSENPDNKDLLVGSVNYLWTPGNVTEQYSRSFAYNFGVKYSNSAKYYLLHDLDILVKENFFIELYENLKESKAMQTYGKRRVLYMSKELTDEVLSNKIDYNALTELSHGVSVPAIFGSKGGSIIFEKDFYNQIGGFDPELFWGYAAEDQIIWDKAITLLGEVDYADNPPIDMLHMWHPPTHATNPLLYQMENYMLQFRAMNKKNRLNFIKEKSTLFINDTKIDNKVYIFTEAYGCGLILKKCLESFFLYHPNEIVHIFGTAKDFKEVGKFKNVEYIELSEDLELKECFKNGHLGTAHIGAKVIKEFSKGYNYIVHFDSDVIFRKESLSLLRDKINEGYDLIGPVRCYKNNMNGRTDLSQLSDVSQTYFYAFNKNKISTYDFNTLRQMIVGYHNPLGHPILDYFDPVSFDILNNKGKIYFLNPDEVGGLTLEGNRKNKFSELNSDMDFGENLMHFAGVGSGMKFYNKGLENASSSYADWAIKRFGLYHKLLYKEALNNIDINEESYNLLKKELNETNN